MAQELVRQIPITYEIRRQIDYDTEVYFRQTVETYIDVLIQAQRPTIVEYDIVITLLNGKFKYWLDTETEEDIKRFNVLQPMDGGGFTNARRYQKLRPLILKKMQELYLLFRGVTFSDITTPATTTTTQMDIGITDNQLQTNLSLGDILLNEPIFTNVAFNQITQTNTAVGGFTKYPRPVYILRFNREEYGDQYPNGITIGDYGSVEYIICHYDKLQQTDDFTGGKISSGYFVQPFYWDFNAETDPCGGSLKQIYDQVLTDGGGSLPPTTLKAYNQIFNYCRLTLDTDFNLLRFTTKTPPADLFSPTSNYPIIFSNSNPVNQSIAQLFNSITNDPYLHLFTISIYLQFLDFHLHTPNWLLLISPSIPNFYFITL